MKLSSQQLQTLAKLSSLTVSSEEEADLERDLDGLLAFCDEVDRLAEEGEDGEEEHACSALRADIVSPPVPLSSLSLADGYFTTEKVLEE